MTGLVILAIASVITAIRWRQDWHENGQETVAEICDQHRISPSCNSLHEYNHGLDSCCDSFHFPRTDYNNNNDDTAATYPNTDTNA
jgi:hypothetical protein